MARRHDWNAIRAHYVEGSATNPDGDPNARTWPTLEEVATVHGVHLTTVARRSAAEGWVASREEFQRQVDQARRAEVAEKRAKQMGSIDTRALTSADAGLALVGKRLEHLTRTELNRGQDAGAGVEPSDLAALGLAARRWVQVRDMVIGKAGLVEEPDDAATQERDQRVAEAVLAARLAEHRARREEDAEAGPVG